jgi:triacylglycerol esterase/lipase EstA (alpha/beta hydrolase family)
MAARSTHVTLTNRTGKNLTKTNDSLDHGIWTDRPPLLIGDRGEWESESDGFLTGTEGRVTYGIDGGGEVRLHWDNPFVGSNSYDQSVAPQATPDGVGGGFSVVHRGGSGDNATVEFILSNGFCEVNEDTGEMTCVDASPIIENSSRFAAIWEADGGPAFQARHNLTADQYQQTFDQLVGQGFRLTCVSGYTVNGQGRFAAIWEAGGGPAFQARHNLTADQYQQTFDQLVGQGFRLTCVNGYSVGGQERFAAIWQADGGPAFQARHNLTADQYQQTFDQLVGQGFRLTCVSGYNVGGQERFAAIWQADGGPAFQARHNLTADQYQQTFDQLIGQGFRLTCVNGYSVGGQERFAAIWQADSGPAFQARHNLTADQYQQTFDQLVGQGFRLRLVNAFERV